MFFNDNEFADLCSGYSIPEDNNFDLNDYPLEPTYGGPPAGAAWAGRFDLDATATSPSTAEIENWWLAPRPEGDPNEYLGSTLLGPSGGGYAGVYGSETEPTSGAGSFTGEPYSRSLTRCSMLTITIDSTYVSGTVGQQPIYGPEYAGPSAAGPSTFPVPLPSQLPSHFPAILAGPRLPPSPVPTLSWSKCLFHPRSRYNCFPIPVVSPPPSSSYLDPENCQYGLYDQPLAEPEMCDKWPYQIPVGKGKSLAAAQPPLTHPLSAGNPSGWILS